MNNEEVRVLLRAAHATIQQDLQYVNALEKALDESQIGYFWVKVTQDSTWEVQLFTGSHWLIPGSNVEQLTNPFVAIPILPPVGEAQK
jgi:hypothetical protein